MKSGSSLARSSAGAARVNHAEMLAIVSLLDPPVPSAGVARAEDVEMLASVKRAG
jgi:hypothetical protein